MADPSPAAHFRQEMTRFLPNDVVSDTVVAEPFWHYVSEPLSLYAQKVRTVLAAAHDGLTFWMWLPASEVAIRPQRPSSSRGMARGRA